MRSRAHVGSSPSSAGGRATSGFARPAEVRPRPRADPSRVPRFGGRPLGRRRRGRRAAPGRNRAPSRLFASDLRPSTFVAKPFVRSSPPVCDQRSQTNARPREIFSIPCPPDLCPVQSLRTRSRRSSFPVCLNFQFRRPG